MNFRGGAGMLKKWKVIFKTLSPIHIKGQKPDYGSGIIRLGRKGYIINEIKLSKFLKEKDLIECYVEYVSQCIKNRKKPFIVFFFNQYKNRIRLDEITLKNISSGITSIGDGNSFICNGNGTYFIPGSSIKGAIRTSLIYHMLNELKNSNQKEFNGLVIDTINRKLTEYNIAKKKYEWRKMDDIKKSFDETIIAKEFQSFFNDLVKIAKVKEGPNTDLLRTLKISDSKKINDVYKENIKVVCYKNDSSFYFGKTKQKNTTEEEISLNVECLHEDTEFITEVSLDLGLLNKFYPDGKMPFNDISSLINIIKEFGERQWIEERDFFQKVQGMQKTTEFYNQNIFHPLLRVGWGTGMLGTTIDLLLDPPLRQRIRNEVMGHNRPGLPAPHSKRIVMRDNLATFPLGWVKIETLKEE